MSVPIATSPGRSGFGPQLSLSYDSDAGNGPFGFGWSLSLPQITRKTDKGLPQYHDAEETDVFILSGAARNLKAKSAAAQYARARESYADALVEKAIQISDESEGDYYIDDRGRRRFNKENVFRSKLRVDTLLWVAGRASHRYSDRAANLTQVNVNGQATNGTQAIGVWTELR